VRLGWSHGDQEIFSLDEMIGHFKLEDVNVSASTFNPEKLVWLNHHYMMNSDAAQVARHLSWHIAQLNIDLSQGPDLIDIVKAQRERCKTLVEMARASVYFYQDFTAYEEKAAKTHFKAEAAQVLQQLLSAFDKLSTWDGTQLHQIVLEVAEKMQLKLGKVAQPLRVAVCGSAVSPAIDVTLSLLGREKTLSRLNRAIQYMQTVTQN
jgi:glutamyl-tRNA synthetase